MRLILASAALLAVMCIDMSDSRAIENAPWCAVTNKGNGNTYWDCQYRTFAECAPNVVSGDRGFCNPTPYFVAGPAARAHSEKRRADRQ
jgi:hypothetical protein